jgi:hypothetical protein
MPAMPTDPCSRSAIGATGKIDSAALPRSPCSLSRVADNVKPSARLRNHCTNKTRGDREGIVTSARCDALFGLKRQKGYNL